MQSLTYRCPSHPRAATTSELPRPHRAPHARASLGVVTVTPAAQPRRVDTKRPMPGAPRRALAPTRAQVQRALVCTELVTGKSLQRGYSLAQRTTIGNRSSWASCLRQVCST